MDFLINRMIAIQQITHFQVWQVLTWQPDRNAGIKKVWVALRKTNRSELGNQELSGLGFHLQTFVHGTQQGAGEVARVIFSQ